jgi:NADH:ubiquinone oxidoreductase subunit D/NADH:ubiquinone oxidoreductase subunit C
MNFQVLSKRLGLSFFYEQSSEPRDYIILPGDESFQYLKVLKEDFNYYLSIDCFGLNSLGQAGLIPDELDYLRNCKGVLLELLNPLSSKVLYVLLALKENNATLVDLTKVWPATKWPLIESFDLNGIENENQVLNNRMLTPKGAKGHLLRGDLNISGLESLEVSKPLVPKPLYPIEYEDSLIRWNELSPFGKENNSCSRILFQSKHDHIINTYIDIGYSHFGLEAILERLKSREQLERVFDCFGIEQSFFHKFAFLFQIESKLGIKITDKNKILRMIGLETFRLKSSISFLKTMVSISGRPHDTLKLDQLGKMLSFVPTGFDLLFTGKIEKILGYNWLHNYIEILGIMDKAFVEVENKITSIKEFKESLNKGSISSKQALDGGLTGVALRSAGVNLDFRKVFPFYFYSELDFEVPVGIYGTVLDRILCLIAESRQSILILYQLLENFPVETDHYQFESLMSEFNVYQKNNSAGVFCSPLNGVNLYLESPIGLLKHFFSIDQKKYFSRYHIRTQSFYSTQFLEHYLIQKNSHMINFLQNSLFINPVELDR